MKNNKGFSIIEVLVVAGIMSVLIVLAGGISSKFASRRSVESITNDIGSNLNLARIRATREGVEIRTDVEYDDENQFVTITSYRGTSNINTPDLGFTSNEISSEQIRLLNDYSIIPDADLTFIFSPASNLRNSQNTITLNIAPDNEDVSIKKCGRISVSPIGRISAIFGTWDFEEGDNNIACKMITDQQEQPSES